MRAPSSLYGRLFPYRERASTSPLENFLTEAIADILNRLPQKQMLEFVSELLIPAGSQPAWLSILKTPGGAACSWTTQMQVPIEEGGSIRPDLVFEIDGQPVLIVEAKVDSPVGRGPSATDADEDKQGSDGQALPVLIEENLGAALDQLDAYGRWLVSRSPWTTESALVLLSRGTEPPERFKQYKEGLLRRHCRWHEVSRWLKAATEQNIEVSRISEEAGWRMLCGELAAFLEEKEMASETLTSRDLAAAELLIPGADRIKATFSRVGATAKAALGDLAVQGPPRFEYNTEGGAMHGYLYLRKPEGQGWHVAWGIRFPDQSQWWTAADPSLPQTIHAYVYLYHDNPPGPSVKRLGIGNLPTAWVSGEDDEMVAAKPLHEFRADPDEMTADFAEWVREKIIALRPCLPILSGGS
jgi:hypothetical protein